MSWFYGVCSKIKNSTIESHPSCNERLLSVVTQNFSINAGGNPSTLFHSELAEDSGWLVLGVGIISNSDRYRILTQSGWEKLLISADFKIDSLGGHFIIIRWEKDKITFQTDRLGLRDFYFRRIKDSIVFSTRLDWLRNSEAMQIDFQEFGSRWLLFNQLSTNSVVKDVTRIVGGKSLTVDRHTLEIKIDKSFWMPKINPDSKQFSKKDYSDLLEKFIFLNSESNIHTSLSLSGGLDSRVLLSYLLRKKNNIDWDTHTFGSANSSDFKIANKISTQLGFQHKILNSEIPDFETLRERMNDYTVQSIINNSASMIIPLLNYTLLKPLQNTIIIDGGFGEIWRREFLAKLFFKGRQALLQKNITKVVSHMRLHRADFFIKEINTEMMKGCVVQLENLFNELPEVAQIGIENWIDLLAIKTRLPNYYGHEQARLDTMIVSYMPLIQIDLLENILRMPVTLRKNARLYRQIIEENSIELTKIGLAKSNLIHPFSMTTLQTRLWSKFVKQLHLKQYKDDSTLNFLSVMKEYINDLCSSSDFQQCGIYDTQKVQGMLSRFNNNQEFLNEVDWLLAFETFRRRICR